MRVAGLDLSLAGTAAVVLTHDGRLSSALAYSSVARDAARRPSWLTLLRSTTVSRGDIVGDYRRTTDVAEAVRVFLRGQLSTGTVVGIEDHAFGAKGTAVYQLGHLHGLVRRDVVSLGCRFLLLGVPEVKRAATGTGAASKGLMVAAAHDLDMPGLSVGLRQGLADAYAVARLTWHVDQLRRHGVAPPAAMAKLARGLAARPLIG